MAYFAQVLNGTVIHVHNIVPSSEPHAKWIALFRSNPTIKFSSNYDVMPGDLFIDERFYKKDIETGETTLLEDGAWVHDKAVRFAGIMDGEIVGQWGLGYENFENQEEINEFVNNILNSQIVEILQEDKSSVGKGWLYDGVIFTPPSDI